MYIEIIKYFGCKHVGDSFKVSDNIKNLVWIKNERCNIQFHQKTDGFLGLKESYATVSELKDAGCIKTYTDEEFKAKNKKLLISNYE